MIYGYTQDHKPGWREYNPLWLLIYNLLLGSSIRRGNLSAEHHRLRIFLQGCLLEFIQFTIVMRLVTSPHPISVLIHTRYGISLHRHQL
jgi:hypothetical protein